MEDEITVNGHVYKTKPVQHSRKPVAIPLQKEYEKVTYMAAFGMPIETRTFFARIKGGGPVGASFLPMMINAVDVPVVVTPTSHEYAIAVARAIFSTKEAADVVKNMLLDRPKWKEGIFCTPAVLFLTDMSKIEQQYDSNNNLVDTTTLTFLVYKGESGLL